MAGRLRPDAAGPRVGNGATREASDTIVLGSIASSTFIGRSVGERAKRRRYVDDVEFGGGEKDGTDSG